MPEAEDAAFYLPAVYVEGIIKEKAPVKVLSSDV